MKKRTKRIIKRIMLIVIIIVLLFLSLILNRDYLKIEIFLKDIITTIPIELIDDRYPEKLKKVGIKPW